MWANLRLTLPLLVILAGTNPVRAEVPLVIDEIEYCLERDSSSTDIAKAFQFTASNARSHQSFWKVALIVEDQKHQICRETRTARMSGIKGGVLVEFDGGSVFFVDTKARKAEPVLDVRARSGKVRCEIHQKSLVNVLAPIHYGLASGRPLTKEQRERFPDADHAFEAGCCVRREQIALLAVCPACGNL